MRNYGLIGKTLAHSFSKKFFDHYFQLHQIDAVFQNFELLQIDELKNVFIKPINGLTVTIPYKESVIPFLDELSEEARNIGAVNVIQFKNGQKIGYNTDAYGFQQSIKPFLTNKHERALILGTGGAAKAVAYVFKNLGIDIIYACRNPKKENEFSFEQINEHMVKACKVIVNCTPVGTFPNVNDFISIPFEFLNHDHLVIDLIYNPEETLFLQKSKEHGATILNGLSMLQHQALEAYRIWNS